MPGDALAQARDAERGGVIDPPRIKRAEAAGWPTSMWMTWPPAASIRSAALITSITMNGGTSLRPEAESRPATRSLSVASPIIICYFTRQIGPAGHVFPGAPD
jgi:hypothetical protein